MQNVERLEVGMTTSISKDMFPAQKLEVGQEYIKPWDSEGWILYADHLSHERPIVVRVDSIEGDVCHCTVTLKLEPPE